MATLLDAPSKIHYTIKHLSDYDRRDSKICNIGKVEYIPKLYQAIKDQADDFLWNKLITDHPDHVFCGQFIKNENDILTVKVYVYINTYTHTGNISEDEEPVKDKTTLLNPSTEWFYQSKVWFKKNPYGEHNYDAFMNYIEPYREPLKVDVTHPIVTFLIEFKGS